MSASVTFPLAAGKTEIVSLSNVDPGTTPSWTVLSGSSTVIPSGDGLSASWFGAPSGDTTVVTLVSQVGSQQDTKTLTAVTYDAGTSGGTPGPDLSIGSPA